MKEEKQRFIVKYSNPYVVMNVFRDTEENLKVMVSNDTHSDRNFSNIYRTAEEAKIEIALLRNEWVKKQLGADRFTKDVEDYAYAERKTLEGEYYKTMKWLEPLRDKYPHVFI